MSDVYVLVLIAVWLCVNFLALACVFKLFNWLVGGKANEID